MHDGRSERVAVLGDGAPGDGSGGEVLDPSVLAAMTSRLGDAAGAFVTRLVATWQAETARRLEELERAAAAGDRPAAGRAAHALKGGSAMVGAVRLAGAAAALEQEAGTADLLAATSRLRAEARAAEAALLALA